MLPKWRDGGDRGLAVPASSYLSGKSWTGQLGWLAIKNCATGQLVKLVNWSIGQPGIRGRGPLPSVHLGKAGQPGYPGLK